MIYTLANFKMMIKSNCPSFFYIPLIYFVVSFIQGCASSANQASSSGHFINYAYKYESNAPIVVKHTAAFNENDYAVYLSINVRRLRMEPSAEVFLKNIKIGYSQRYEYSGENIVTVDSIPASSMSVKKVKDSFICRFSISRNSNFPPYLFVEVSDKKTDYKVIEDLYLESQGKSNYWKGILFSITDSVPVFDKFIKKDDSYKLLLEGALNKAFVNLISYEFPPAPAPMSSSAKAGPKKLNIDTVYLLPSFQKTSFDSTGLYLIQEDTSLNTGLGFRVTDEKYPKYTKLTSLIKPLVYISTTEEIKTLVKSTDKKKAFDAYWLKHAGNANDGRRLIKFFYDRVEEANQRFTGYKEGWKTDMGMIYIIFGPPNFVYRTGDQEQWIYEKSEGMSEVKFTFVKVPNLYTNNHYELIRYPEYEEYWYKKVDLWRKGAPGI